MTERPLDRDGLVAGVEGPSRSAGVRGGGPRSRPRPRCLGFRARDDDPRAERALPTRRRSRRGLAARTRRVPPLARAPRPSRLRARGVRRDARAWRRRGWLIRAVRLDVRAVRGADPVAVGPASARDCGRRGRGRRRRWEYRALPRAHTVPLCTLTPGAGTSRQWRWHRRWHSGTRPPSDSRRTDRWRIACGVTGLALIVLAFVSPLQQLALHYVLTAHLLQNVVLAEWAPALLVFGLPPSLARRVASADGGLRCRSGSRRTSPGTRRPCTTSRSATRRRCSMSSI